MNTYFRSRLIALAMTALAIPLSVASSFRPLEGADWITVNSDSHPIYPDYLSVFRLGFRLDMPEGESASLLFGVDDPRLMDANKNIYRLANSPGESYFRIQMDEDSVRLFRSGYHPDDNPKTALATFPTGSLRHSADSIEVAVNNGWMEISVNGKSIGSKGMNPLGNGGDYIAFPVLAGVVVETPDGSEAKISDITVSNFRDPRNVICRLESTDDVHGFQGRVSMPSRSMP